VTGQRPDELAEMAAGLLDGAPGPAGGPGRYALTTLMRLGDPRWVDLLCAAAEHGHRMGWPGQIPLTAPVLAAVRNALSTQPARADVLNPIIWRWGPDAATAVPELTAALGQVPDDVAIQVTGTLLTMGHEEPALLPHVRHRVA
jgi:hypothetical protein